MVFSAQDYFHYLPFDPNGLSVEEIRAKVDEEILQLQKRILTFQTIRNSLVPISQIPTEVISKIFIHATNNDALERRENALATPIPISWVCRQWREIALDIPQLWCTITPPLADPTPRFEMGAGQVQTFIQRSGDLLLAVDLLYPSERALITCLRQLPRIRKLRITRALMGLSTSQVPRNPAPLLESLDLEAMPILSALELFHNINPNLDILRIALCCIGWQDITPLRHFTTSITRLHLTRVHQSGIDVNSLIHLIASIPNLLEIQLALTLSEFPSGDLPHHNRRSLSHLQMMTVYDDSTKAFDFFQRIDIPLASTHLITYVKSTNWEQLYSSFNEYQRSMLFDIRHLELRKVSSEYEYGLLSICSDSMSHHHSLRLPSHHGIESIWDDLWLPQLMSISLDGVPFGSAGTLLRLCNVEAVKVIGSPREILELLSPYSTAGYRTTGGKVAWVFPQLKELHLGKLGYGEYQILMDTLASREESGLGPVKVHTEGRAPGEWTSSYSWDHPKHEPDARLMRLIAPVGNPFQLFDGGAPSVHGGTQRRRGQRIDSRIVT